VGPLRLAFEDDLWCGELPFAGGFRHLAGASVLTIVFSLRLAAPRFRRRSLNSDGYPRQSLFRSSITRLSHSLSTLRSFPSRSRGRTATQDSLPAGGQPLPDRDRYPARSQTKFQSLPSRYTTSSSSKLRNAINVRVMRRGRATVVCANVRTKGDSAWASAAFETSSEPSRSAEEPLKDRGLLGTNSRLSATRR
jgi:hypothetical protein